jgi:hypothetical protein
MSIFISIKSTIPTVVNSRVISAGICSGSGSGFLFFFFSHWGTEVTELNYPVLSFRASTGGGKPELVRWSVGDTVIGDRWMEEGGGMLN